MIVAIFGASGGIGKFAVKHALLKGHQVRAFLRNPSKLETMYENIVIIKGGADKILDKKHQQEVVRVLKGKSNQGG